MKEKIQEVLRISEDKFLLVENLEILFNQELKEQAKSVGEEIRKIPTEKCCEKCIWCECENPAHKILHHCFLSSCLCHKQPEQEGWEKRFRKNWRIERLLIDITPEQEIAFSQHERKLEEIESFISQEISTAHQKGIEEGKALERERVKGIIEGMKKKGEKYFPLCSNRNECWAACSTISRVYFHYNLALSDLLSALDNK